MGNKNTNAKTTFFEEIKTTTSYKELVIKMN